MSDLVERLRAEIADQRNRRGTILDYGDPDPLLVEAIARITALEASLAEAEGRVIAARRQALEEAAKACEAHMSQCLDDRDIQKRWPQIKAHNAVYAGVVRALEDSPPPPTVV